MIWVIEEKSMSWKPAGFVKANTFREALDMMYHIMALSGELEKQYPHMSHRDKDYCRVRPLDELEYELMLLNNPRLVKVDA